MSTLHQIPYLARTSIFPKRSQVIEGILVILESTEQMDNEAKDAGSSKISLPKNDLLTSYFKNRKHKRAAQRPMVQRQQSNVTAESEDQSTKESEELSPLASHTQALPFEIVLEIARCAIRSFYDTNRLMVAYREYARTGRLGITMKTKYYDGWTCEPRDDPECDVCPRPPVPEQGIFRALQKFQVVGGLVAEATMEEFLDNTKFHFQTYVQLIKFTERTWNPRAQMGLKHLVVEIGRTLSCHDGLCSGFDPALLLLQQIGNDLSQGMSPRKACLERLKVLELNGRGFAVENPMHPLHKSKEERIEVLVRSCRFIKARIPGLQIKVSGTSGIAEPMLCPKAAFAHPSESFWERHSKGTNASGGTDAETSQTVIESHLQEKKVTGDSREWQKMFWKKWTVQESKGVGAERG